jgi:hypothetical protein
MGLKLAEATKACRIRRTRGEIALWWVATGRCLVWAAGFLTAGVLSDGALGDPESTAWLRFGVACAAGFGGGASAWVGTGFDPVCCDA